MSKYDPERRFRADRYLPAQLSILANRFTCNTTDIRLATLEEDLTAATDVVLPNGKTVGLRVRQPNQMKHYGDLIIRHQPNAQYPTEYDKLLSGTPDYLLYAIALDETRLGSWWLINCHAIRAAYHSGWRCTVPPSYIRLPNDGFQVFKLSGFLSTPPLIIATSDSRPSNRDRICPSCRRNVG